MSARVHGAIHVLGERPSGLVVGRSSPDEGVGGRGGSGRTHGECKAADVSIIVVSERDWSDDPDREVGSWYEPTQADARRGVFARPDAGGTEEMPAVPGLVRWWSPVWYVSVAGWGRRERKSAIPFGHTFPVLQRICLVGEELQLTLDAGVVLVYLGDKLDRLVVGIGDELGRPKITA